MRASLTHTAEIEDKIEQKVDSHCSSLLSYWSFSVLPQAKSASHVLLGENSRNKPQNRQLREKLVGTSSKNMGRSRLEETQESEESDDNGSRNLQSNKFSWISEQEIDPPNTEQLMRCRMLKEWAWMNQQKLVHFQRRLHEFVHHQVEAYREMKKHWEDLASVIGDYPSHSTSAWSVPQVRQTTHSFSRQDLPQNGKSKESSKASPAPPLHHPTTTRPTIPSDARNPPTDPKMVFLPKWFLSRISRLWGNTEGETMHTESKGEPQSETDSETSDTEATESIPEEQLRILSISAMKQILKQRGVDYSQCIEKQEFQNLIRTTKQSNRRAVHRKFHKEKSNSTRNDQNGRKIHEESNIGSASNLNAYFDQRERQRNEEEKREEEKMREEKRKREEVVRSKREKAMSRARQSGGQVHRHARHSAKRPHSGSTHCDFESPNDNHPKPSQTNPFTAEADVPSSQAEEQTDQFWSKNDTNAQAWSSGPFGFEDSSDPLDSWIEAKTDDGRVYYFHRITRQVRWNKPEVRFFFFFF